MSQSPTAVTSLSPDHPYAQGANQLNRLVREGRSFSGYERNCCYLNTGETKFANLSTISGIDFPEDGRAIAASDWDFDGDLDFWVANRTGPQIRWMRNDLETDHHFVSVQLVGTNSNRDAIGATVRLYVANERAPLVKTLRAGEGFLAQRSKWLHFGLGKLKKIQRAEVRWPAGDAEPIEGVAVDRFQTVVEGSGVAQIWLPPEMPKLKRVTTVVENPTSSAATQVLLGRSAPLPPLHFIDETGKRADATQTNDRPRLVNIWATWCEPCLAELKAWGENEQLVRDAGIDILALSVDGLSEDVPGDSRIPAEFLHKLEFPYQSGLATTELLDIMQLVNNAVFRDDHRRLPVPTSLLIDRDRRLAALYRGPVDCERIVADARALDFDSEDRLRSALPFPGRWMGLPGPHRIAKLVDKLWESGYEDRAVELTQRMPLATTDDARPTDEKVQALHFLDNRLQAAGRGDEAEQCLRDLLKIDPEDGKTYLKLGVLAAKQNKLKLAVNHFENATRFLDPPEPAAYANLAQAYRQTGEFSAAEAAFRQGLAIDSQSGHLHSGLGLLMASQAKFAEAAESFRTAAAVEPTNPTHRLNLATAKLQLGEPEAALKELEIALKIDPANVTAKVYASEALVALQRPREAIARLQEVVQQQPKATQIWLRLGRLATQTGEVSQAIQYFDQARELAPNEATLAGNLAWILATAPDENDRDGDRAVRLAKQAVEGTSRQSPQLLDALAAALAEVGRFSEAESIAAEALELLKNRDAENLENAITERRKGYAERRPFRISVEASR